MNADDDNYDDPGQSPKHYADTGDEKDRVKRKGAGQRLNSTLPPPPSELQPPINRLVVAVRMPMNEPPIPMVDRPAAEDEQRPFSNIYAATLTDTEVVRDFINEQRGTITKMGLEITGLLKKLRMMRITLAITVLLLLTSMGALAYGEKNY